MRDEGRTIGVQIEVHGGIQLSGLGFTRQLPNPMNASDRSEPITAMKATTTLLLVLPLPIYQTGSTTLIDAQALNGLHRWLDNFDRLILCMPALPVAEAPSNTVPFDLGDRGSLCQLEALPNAYSPHRFARALVATTRRLDHLIDQSTHLSFAIGGLFGDWAAVAALRAARKKRRASVWTDRVESRVTYVNATRKSGLRRYYELIQSVLMKHYERAVIRRTAIGLFHGADCFDAYASYSPQPHLVHDIHLDASARIPIDALRSKIVRAATHEPLRILYVGRAHPDKGVLDWVEVLRLLAGSGVAFRATWLGDGPELDVARDQVKRLGLTETVDFPGSTNDRAAVMDRLRDADLFLFCHKTPESPRCLIEALISAAPIVGYDSAYPRDLISHHHGGVLLPHQPELVAAAIERLANDRSALANLIEAAAADGRPFNDADVFRHRSDIIKG